MRIDDYRSESGNLTAANEEARPTHTSVAPWQGTASLSIGMPIAIWLEPSWVANESKSDTEPRGRILLENFQISDIALQHGDGLMTCLLHDLSIRNAIFCCLSDAP